MGACEQKKNIKVLPVRWKVKEKRYVEIKFFEFVKDQGRMSLHGGKQP